MVSHAALTRIVPLTLTSHFYSIRGVASLYRPQGRLRQHHRSHCGTSDVLPRRSRLFSQPSRWTELLRNHCRTRSELDCVRCGPVSSGWSHGKPDPDCGYSRPDPQQPPARISAGDAEDARRGQSVRRSAHQSDRRSGVQYDDLPGAVQCLEVAADRSQNPKNFSRHWIFSSLDSGTAPAMAW